LAPKIKLYNHEQIHERQIHERQGEKAGLEGDTQVEGRHASYKRGGVMRSVLVKKIKPLPTSTTLPQPTARFRATALERAIQNAGRTRAAYKTLFDSEQLSDITVVIGDREAKLHKCVLSGCEYFERMLSTEFKEATAKAVKLEVAEGPSAEATLLAIEYIYSGYVDFHQHSDSVMEVLAAADKLQLTHLST
jgi:hypothetical protein